MFQRFKKYSLEKQMFLSYSVATALVLIVTFCLILLLDINRQQEELDRMISGSAEYIASLDEVSAMLERGYPNGQVKIRLDQFHQSYPELDIIAVYNCDKSRFYHTDRRETGETLVESEATAILEGDEPYITTGYGTYGTQRKAFHAVRGEDGSVIGFVTVAVFTSAILRGNLSLIILFLPVLLFSMLMVFALSHGIVRLLKNSLRGYHPAELLDLYLRQGSVLNAIKDGLVATDPSGQVIFANEAACDLFSADEAELQGRDFSKVFQETDCVQVARTGEAVRNRSSVIKDRQILISELPIQSDSGIQGVLNIFHDKTEMRQLSDELSGTRYMLDTLRFFNHEFMNKLHIILGYLQTGQPQQAMRFIMNTSLVSGQNIRETADCIRVSRLCALIIGKMMHASESGIRLSVSRDSVCREEDLLIPVEDYATIIGNLLENAIEELSRTQQGVKEIKLSVYCRSDCNIVVCEDTGRGIAPEIAARIWEDGVSSKGEGRGVGLYLVRQLVETYGGTIELETEAGEGTSFTLTFTQKGGT